MYRVTKDTNILVSALNFPGLPFRLIELARTGAFRLQISDPILDEMAQVLQRQFGWTRERAIHARKLVQSFSQYVTPHIELDVVKEDPDDNRILECAQASQSDYLVTRDKHLLRLGQYSGTRILGPEDFLGLLQTGIQGP